MRYPNLSWAISNRRHAHYEVAQACGMSEWRFSRAVSGRCDFAPEEQEKIASFLSYAAGWLFAAPKPPSSKPATLRRDLTDDSVPKIVGVECDSR